MTDSDKRDAFTLKRWSQRKLAAARVAQTAPAPQSPAPPASAEAKPAVPPAEPATAPPATEPLPPVDSLTFESDFTSFLRPDVDETVKRGALRKLFSDPRFNIMDGLDVYIDDYSKPDPLPAELVRELAHARSIFDPPQTRVTADGCAEDVPPQSNGDRESEPAAQAAAAPLASSAAPDAAAPGAEDAPVGAARVPEK